MAAKLTRLTHKIAIQLHLVAESCTICSSHSRQVRKLLDTPSYSLSTKCNRLSPFVDENSDLRDLPYMCPFHALVHNNASPVINPILKFMPRPPAALTSTKVHACYWLNNMSPLLIYDTEQRDLSERTKDRGISCRKYRPSVE
jgi:hypothetical protein